MSSLNIVVPVKHVPDAQLERGFTEDLTLDRANSILSELDEYPLEAAMALREARPEAAISVFALCMGPAQASAAVKKALQLGADAGFHVLDDALAGSDALGTARTLAAAIAHIGAEHGGVDLVLTGMTATDAETSLVPAQLAELLDLPLVTRADSLEWSTSEGADLAATRATAHATANVETRLPALVSVTDQANTPRYPNFKAIMAAKKKPVTVLSLEDLGLDASQVGSAGALIEVMGADRRPERQQGEIIRDEGDAGVKLVDFLAAERLI
ncbi:electron transfer flavoprotein subunit beta/FixA family protein [Falsarthrobacter nasiphocae]|uniref:Electron transfer flavoprotein subunit beta n=1 Tax=Falsarthrobacter nasiphocae TaxID=189863 RepID=A0AAE3YFR1_9MICC|nr:electron transfer flavoprotein subunit beta/FixA family protein [Falsarthrobacter nasiphocae]MDR6891902.1 electron transfer flavoprotein beta subunit [Falsarthrobacter nasiphocae]